MNKVRVAIFATAFAFGVAPAFGDDEPAKPVGETETKSAPPAQARQTRPLPTKGDKQIGDFPPYYGKSVQEWKVEEKRRKEREYERLEKLTPKEQDEESVERKRRQQEWQKMRPQEKDPGQTSSMVDRV